MKAFTTCGWSPQWILRRQPLPRRSTQVLMLNVGSGAVRYQAGCRRDGLKTWPRGWAAYLMSRS